MKPLQSLRFGAARRLPVILQAEMSECGLACLSMVAAYCGYNTDLTMLRRRFPVTLKGMTLRTLIDIADQLHLAARAVRLEPESLKDLKRPAILHWDLNHFVVLKSISGQRITLHDPAVGVRSLSIGQASQHFTGVALELLPTPEFKAGSEVSVLRIQDLWTRIQGLKRSLLQIFLLAVSLQIFALISPYYMQLVVDNIIVSRDLDLLVVVTIGFLLITIFKVATDALRSWVVLYLGTTLNYQLASIVFRHLLRLPLDFFGKRHIGDIVSRFSSLDQIRTMLTTGFIEALVDGLMVTTTLVMMFIYSSTLGAIALGAVALYSVVRVALFKPFRERTEQSIVAAGQEDSAFLETVRAVQAVKIFGRETERHAVWQNQYAKTMNADVSVAKIQIIYTTINQLIVGLEYVVLIFLGAKAIMSNVFSIGMLYAFLAYRQQFSSKAQALVDKIFEYKMLNLHLCRVSDIALADPEPDLRGSSSLNKELAGAIELRKVSFRYSSDEARVIRNLDLKVSAGEFIAIVGPSGCGKTTLLKLIMGLLKPTAGLVLLDGVDIRRMGLRAYRGISAAVMQDDQLLSRIFQPANRLTF